MKFTSILVSMLMLLLLLNKAVASADMNVQVEIHPHHEMLMDHCQSDTCEEMADVHECESRSDCQNNHCSSLCVLLISPNIQPSMPASEQASFVYLFNLSSKSNSLLRPPKYT